MAQLGGHGMFMESRTTQIAHGDTATEIGDLATVTISRDQGPRDTTAEGLAKLKALSPRGRCRTCLCGINRHVFGACPGRAERRRL